MEFFGLLFGLLAIGYAIFFLVLPFLIKGISNRLNSLEKQLRETQASIQEPSRFASTQRAQEPEVSGFEPAAPVEDAVPAVEAAPEAVHVAPAAKEVVEEIPGPVAEAKKVPTVEEPTPAAGESPGWQPLVGTDLEARIKAWLIGGNTVARVGIIILFLGVAFFLKYAIDRGWLPVELRLSGAALGGLALIATGWRLQTRRRNYALILQGGGMGIVYLTVFAAVNLYGLITTIPGLLLMVTLVVLSSALAILQNARSLAVLAMVGGFLAPVLISRDGNHVALFSYYAVLNAGVLGMAWFKAWRELNLIGFIFTFVISALWGYRYYQPDYFTTTEPFLLLFFVFYVAVPVLFARRGPPNLKGYVDGSLVFGVPLVAFGLQAALVRDFEYGLALSALGAGLFYIILATALWRGRQESMRMLTEAFLALAIVFGTLAIPLAVDGRWTGAAWAIEGAALVWIGVRQRRLLARLFGLLVEVGAGIAFLTEIGATTADVFVLNSFYLSALIVSFSGLFTAFYLNKHRKTLPVEEALVSVVMLVWGLLWWFGAGINEILKHVNDAYDENAILGFVTASVAVIAVLRRRLDWQYLCYPPLALLPVMVITALLVFETMLVFEATSIDHPLAQGGWLAWPFAFVVQYWLLRRLEPDWPKESVPYLHSATFWLAIFLATWEAAWVIEQATTGMTWSYITWALVPTAVIMAIPRLESRFTWPIQKFRTSYLGLGLLPVILALGIWILHASLQPGDPRPLPYVPLLNPLELSQCLALIAILRWSWHGWLEISEQSRWFAWSALSFVALNGMIARATHHLGDITFNMDSLWNSPTYQSAVSITWTLVALGIMVTSTKLKQHAAWMVGAVLLGAVVLKLFLVDLAEIGTVARIVSFIIVGLLILLIGYLSPLPPRTKESSEP